MQICTTFLQYAQQQFEAHFVMPRNFYCSFQTLELLKLLYQRLIGFFELMILCLKFLVAGL